MLAARGGALTLLLACGLSPAVTAQDLEPRRWTHMPVGMNVFGVSYAYTEGAIGFDPVLELEQVTVDSHTTVLAYSRAFDCLGKSARLDVIVPSQSVRWDGLVSGTPGSREATGLADPWMRFSLLLLGAPPLRGKDYAAYRAAHPVQTVAGVALAVSLPLGQYDADALLNIGSNRFAFRPQIGVVHTRGPWSFELTSSMYLFTDNDDFFNGNTRAQDPVYALQGHAIRRFAGGWWGSLSAGHGWSGETTVNGVSRRDPRESLLSALSVGVPVGKTQGLKLNYLRSDKQKTVGSDVESLVLSWSLRF